MFQREVNVTNYGSLCSFAHTCRSMCMNLNVHVTVCVRACIVFKPMMVCMRNESAL